MNFVVLGVGSVISTGLKLGANILWFRLGHCVCYKTLVNNSTNICIPEFYPPPPRICFFKFRLFNYKWQCSIFTNWIDFFNWRAFF
ncbi:MAG: hypothetical protein ACFFGP_14875 [Promethearchaeota archaeon]